MRKTLIILALATATIMAHAGDAFAQRRGGGGGYRGGSWNGNRSGVSVRFGYGGGYYGGRGYYGGGYYGGSYAPSYYYSSPGYYYSDAMPATEIRQSGYYAEPAASSQQVATLNVILPSPNAQVWFDGSPTSQQGMERTFYTPPLERGTYNYTIRARWMENGQAVERERRVNVQPGQTVAVNFRNPTGESVPLPKRPD